ncbi:Oncosphere antigen A [Taenia solium]|eukprot:TsM_000495600 transcript=TsM_000495600 gene=TsM_000495600
METKSIASYFNLSRVSPNQLQFTWKAQSLMELKVSLVRVIAKPNSSSGIYRYATASVSSEKVTVDALEPYTLYNVTVEATGEEIQFMQLMGLIRTWPTAPSSTPAPTGRGISRTKIKLEWSKPSQLNGILEPYRATCYNLMRGANPIIVSTEDNKTTTVIVDKLDRNTKYKCVVEASTVPAYGQDSKDCTRMSASPYPIQTLDAAMQKPIFEAVYYEGRKTLGISVHDPEGVEGEFLGYEVLLKTSDFESHNSWQFVVNLTAKEREYELPEIELSRKYAVTVRGRVLPDEISEMADSLVFETMEAGVSVPRNVELQASSPYRVHMTWNPPIKSYGHIAGYTIEWSLDSSRQKSVNISSVNFHDFTDLEPGQTIVVSICAHNQPNTSVKFDYVGTQSAFANITIPQSTQEYTSASAATTNEPTSTSVLTTTKGSTSILAISTATKSLPANVITNGGLTSVSMIPETDKSLPILVFITSGGLALTSAIAVNVLICMAVVLV